MTALPVGDPPPGYDRDDLEREHWKFDDDDDRQRFARDYDRLVHTSAFRRLQGKTQVVTPGEADFFRTRLTHTIEVAQVARRLARKLKCSPSLCEASAVLHDLGHPPFAHIGERTLCRVIDAAAKEWGLKDDHEGRDEVGGFNGNAQSFRLAVKSLSHKAGFHGLDLTRGVLDGAIKYPHERAHPDVPKSDDSWCFYPTEKGEAGWVRRGVPAERDLEKSFEAQIVDWADDVAYAIHDVEDWYRAGFMPLEMLVASQEARNAFGKQVTRALEKKGFGTKEVADEIESFFTSLTFGGITSAYDGSRDTKRGIQQMRSDLFDAFTDVAASGAGDPTRHNNDLKIKRVARLRNDILKQMLWVYVIAHPRMATHQAGQSRVIEDLFRIHLKALDFDHDKRQIGKDAELDIFAPGVREDLEDAHDLPAELLRLIADHIAGMTDGYATRLHARLTGIEQGVFNAFV